MSVPLVHFDPPAGYALGVELYPGPELRRRGASKPAVIERLDFHVLLYLTRGGYRHMVDFETVHAKAGSAVLVQPGRVHRFGDLRRFHGWFLIFRSESLPPSLGRAELPAHTLLPPSDRPAVRETLERMAADARGVPTPTLGAILDSQVQTLLLRLAAAAPAPAAPVERTVLERYQRFRALVDREHHRWHTVRRYAKTLGCSDKSLHRATREVVGMSAKEVVTSRLVLEAKRRLAHSTTPVANLSDDLGFSEPTNFVKFFRRETGVTPGTFRRSQQVR